MIYLFGMLLSFFFAFIIEKSIQFSCLTVKKQYERKCTTKFFFLLILTIFPLFLISGLRKGIGTDYSSYERIFFDIKYERLNDPIEWGYILLNKLCGFFTSSPQSIFIVTSFLFCFFTCLSIYQQSEQISLSVVFLVLSLNYCISLNVVRQFLGMAICIYAFKFIYQQKLIKYLFFVLLASSIHAVCIIFVLVYFFAYVRLNKKRILCLFMLFVLAIPCYEQLLNIALKGTKYYKLLTSFPVAGNLYSCYMIIFNLIWLWIIYHKFSENIHSLKNRLFLNMQVCAVAFSLLLPVIPQIERVLWMFAFPQFITIPSSLKGIKKKRNRYLITMVMLIIMGLFFYLNIVIYRNHQVWPYKTIFGRN
ncbi:MAG: EpsG family protein [Lacrimispora saccharolytica]|uniref:EpsG family protein n=1 Tax=Clostridium sp. M62/1 TaxID=411486 RepID=UPI0035645448